MDKSDPLSPRNAQATTSMEPPSRLAEQALRPYSQGLVMVLVLPCMCIRPLKLSTNQSIAQTTRSSLKVAESSFLATAHVLYVYAGTQCKLKINQGKRHQDLRLL